MRISQFEAGATVGLDSLVGFNNKKIRQLVDALDQALTKWAKQSKLVLFVSLMLLSRRIKGMEFESISVSDSVRLKFAAEALPLVERYTVEIKKELKKIKQYGHLRIDCWPV
jgi:hypothetical protein